jgi:hypothetical protein
VPALSTADVLDAWERGLAGSRPERAALLAGLAGDGTDDGLTVGARDARLLDLRERLFGSRVAGEASCPACGERLELAFDVADVRVAPPPSPGPVVVAEGGWEVRARPVTVADVDAAAAADDPRAALLARCVEDVRGAHGTGTLGDLPEPITALVVARLAEADPQADVSLALACESCRQAWDLPFDPAAFLWDELTQWAVRTLDEVAQLAAAYGWSEADILGLSPWRRQRYLAGVTGS